MNSSNNWGFGLIIFTIFLCLSIFIIGVNKNANSEPISVYTVYLDGKSIGAIASKESFEKFINSKEEELKHKYDVDTVYTPKGVEIKKNITYNSSVKSDEQVYREIINSKKFTVKGYEITINYKDKEKEAKKIYVLDKNIFDEAVVDTIKAFVDEEQYNKFVNGSQEEIKDSGSMIENIDLEENITYKETYIPTDKDIFVNAEELSKYLLYGTLARQKTYVVKGQDTI